MSRFGLNVFLLVIVAVLVLLAWVLRRDVQEPNYLFTPEMVISVPYDSYASNENYVDGKTQQLPVAGTVARGAVLFEYEATEADALRAGKELVSPWGNGTIDPDSLLAAKSRGRKIFSTFCLPCHGAVGNGDGPVAMNGFPPPPSLSAESGLKMSDGQMFHVLTFGQKNMPSYASQISVDDRWKAIIHVRSLQEAAVKKIESEKQANMSIAAGKQIYEKLNCNKCHTVSADEKPVGPFLGKVAGVYSRELLQEAILHPSKTIAEGYVTQVFFTIDGDTHSGFVTGETDEEITIRNSDGNEIKMLVDDIEDRRTVEKSPMPDGLIKELTDEELQSLLDYLKSLAVAPATVEPSGAGQEDEKAKSPDDGEQVN